MEPGKIYILHDIGKTELTPEEAKEHLSDTELPPNMKKIIEGVGKMKTINDLHKLSMTDPVVNRYMKLFELKEVTLEEALIGMVFSLRDQKNEVTEKYINHLNNCTMPNEPKRGGLVSPDGGDYPLKWMGREKDE